MLANPFEVDLLACQVKACRVSLAPCLFSGRAANVGDSIVFGVDADFLPRLLRSNRWGGVCVMCHRSIAQWIERFPPSSPRTTRPGGPPLCQCHCLRWQIATRRKTCLMY